MEYIFLILAVLFCLFCAANYLLGLGLLNSSFITRYVPENKQRLYRWVAGAGYLLAALSFVLRLLSPLLKVNLNLCASLVFATGILPVAVITLVFYCRKR